MPKISELSPGGTLLGNELIPVIQNGVTVKVAVDQLPAPANAPTADEKAALAGAEGTPSASNPYVTTEDSRLPTLDEKGSFPATASAAEPLALASDERFPTADEKAGISALTAADPAVPRSELVYQAADYTALRTITGQTAGKQASVAYRTAAGDGGGGMFRWDASDLSAQVAADTQSGIYVAPTSDATGASGAWVYAEKPTGRGSRPAYVETFMGIHSTPFVPANIATYTSGAAPGGGYLNQYTVTVASGGVAGSTSITVSESVMVAGMGGGIWPCAIEHSDGTHEFNVVMTDDGVDTLTLKFPLEKQATYISPTWDATLSQHMSKRGYRAYAEHLFKKSASECTATKFTGSGCFAHQPPKYQQLWSMNDALVAYGRISVNDVVSEMNAQTLTGNYYTTEGRLARSSYEPCGVVVGVHAIGHGIEGQFTTGGRRGFIETHLYTTSGNSTTPAVRGEATLTVYASFNGSEKVIYTKTFSDFLERVVIPFSDCESLRLEAVSTRNEAFFIHVMDTKCWAANDPAIPLIDKNAKVVTMGDSWFAYYSSAHTAVTLVNGAFSAHLQHLMREAGGTGRVVNKSRGGMTTAWALAWFDNYVLPEKPDQVVFHFFTNDANSNETATFTGPDGSTMSNVVDTKETWRANIAKLAAKCEANGIQPIFIMPSGTASGSQGQTQIQWFRSIRKGFRADSVPQATADELADFASFINQVGKATGKQVTVGSSIFHAQGPAPTDNWRNIASERISALEVVTYDFSQYDPAIFEIGADDNVDGLSNGVTTQPYGDNTNNTYVTDIVSGKQRQMATYGSPASTGNRRLKFGFTCSPGNDYLLIAQIEGASPSVNVDAIGDFYSAAVSMVPPVAADRLTDANGDWEWMWRLDNVTTTNAYWATAVTGSRSVLPVSYETVVKRVVCIDLTLFAAQTNAPLDTMTDQEIRDLVITSLDRIPPEYIRMTDQNTGDVVKVSVQSGVLVVD